MILNSLSRPLFASCAGAAIALGGLAVTAPAAQAAPTCTVGSVGVNCGNYPTQGACEQARGAGTVAIDAAHTVRVTCEQQRNGQWNLWGSISG